MLKKSTGIIIEFVSSVRWHFFVFRNSVEKFCISWAFPLIECVAVWALKPPVVSAPLRSLHNRSPPDFLQLIPTYSKPTRHKVFLRNYWNTKEPAANICHKPILPNSVFLYLITAFRNTFLDAVAAASSPLTLSPFPLSQNKNEKKTGSYICHADIPLPIFFVFILQP